MTNHQESGLNACTHEHEPVFIAGMIWVGDQASKLIGKDRPGFVKRDAVLLLIRGIFLIVPLEGQMIHNDNIITL